MYLLEISHERTNNSTTFPWTYSLLLTTDITLQEVLVNYLRTYCLKFYKNKRKKQHFQNIFYGISFEGGHIEDVPLDLSKATHSLFDILSIKKPLLQEELSQLKGSIILNWTLDGRDSDFHPFLQINEETKWQFHLQSKLYFSVLGSLGIDNKQHHNEQNDFSKDCEEQRKKLNDVEVQLLSCKLEKNGLKNDLIAARDQFQTLHRQHEALIGENNSLKQQIIEVKNARNLESVQERKRKPKQSEDEMVSLNKSLQESVGRLEKDLHALENNLRLSKEEKNKLESEFNVMIMEFRDCKEDLETKNKQVAELSLSLSTEHELLKQNLATTLKELEETKAVLAQSQGHDQNALKEVEVRKPKKKKEVEDRKRKQKVTAKNSELIAALDAIASELEEFKENEEDQINDGKIYICGCNAKIFRYTCYSALKTHIRVVHQGDIPKGTKPESFGSRRKPQSSLQQNLSAHETKLPFKLTGKNIYSKKNSMVREVELSQ